MDKKKIIRNVVIISIIVLIIGVLVVSYAMFFNTSNSDNSTKLGNLDVEYVDGDEVTIDNLLPINNDEVEEKSSVFNFSVENKGNSYAYYDIKLVDINLPLALKDENFKWRLLSNDELINEGNFHELVNTKDYLKRSIRIDNSKEVKKYKLQLWIENSNDIDQNYMLNKSGSFKIQIEANSKLASSPKDEVIVISNTTNGDLEDLKIYGNTVDGENVGDNKTINITVSQNLVDNGLGELGNNTNFSQLTYNDEKYKSLGSFYRNNDVRYDVRTSNIAINTENEYYMNMCAKDNQTGSRYYFGYVNVDVDKKEGWWENYSSVGLTTLKKDLKNGDDTVYLEDTSSFNGNTKYQNDGLIFWNYTDSRGYTYSPETYSKNVWHSLYEFENINRENNTIKLNTLWNNGTFTKGTKVSQSAGAVSYMYPILNNSLLTNEYKCYSAVIDGRSSTYSFNSGVKYIKMLMLNNYYSVQNTETYYSRIVLRKNDNIQNITIDMNGHDPLRSIDDTRDYIDYKNKRIVRLINSDGTKKEREEYEPITLPEIKTYDGNTIIESSDDISPIFQANY